MTPLSKGEIVYTRADQAAMVRGVNEDGSLVAIMFLDPDNPETRVVAREAVRTLAECWRQDEQQDDALETVALVCASIVAGFVCALAFLL